MYSTFENVILHNSTIRATGTDPVIIHWKMVISPVGNLFLSLGQEWHRLSSSDIFTNAKKKIDTFEPH